LVFAATPALAKRDGRSHRHQPAPAPAAATASAELELLADPAPEPPGPCETAYQSAQERERTGHLTEAKDAWLACAKAACGTFLHNECSVRYTQLEADIPSVVPSVTDDAGAPRTAVEVKMDGEVLTAQIDGRALPIDPGLHEFSFSTDAGVFSTQKLMILQGQRNRLISASLHAPGRPARKKKAVYAAADDPFAAESTARSRAAAVGDGAAAGETPGLDLVAHGAPVRSGPSKVTYVLGGLGLAGLGSAALLTYWGRKDNDLLGQCATSTTTCPPSSVAHIKRLYLGADISLGVGAAALGAAYWVYALTRPGHQAAAGRESSVAMFDVQPTPSGAVATVSGSF
jgi:hypothetical protein